MSRTAQLSDSSAEPITFELPSGRIAALRAGADDAPDVLLVPGYTGSKEDFAPILDALAELGLRATAIDLPGQFESPGPEDPAEYTPVRLARCLLEIAALSDRPVHLVGHSFGGLVARAAVIDEPSRFADLVLMDSGPAAIEGMRRSRIDALEPALQLGLPGLWDAMQAALATEPGYVAAPDDIATFLQKRFLGGSLAMLEGMGNAIRTEPDRVDELRATGVRMLVMHGTDDDAWPPPVQDEMARRLGVPCVVVPDAGHSPAVENPEATVAVLRDFWQASLEHEHG